MDRITPQQRSRIMSAIRSTNTKDEVRLAKALWHLGYRCRKNDKTVFGIPDLTFKKLKIALFVDSGFFDGKD
jgi:DNA mismatch endonuclease (patch repair protein)